MKKNLSRTFVFIIVLLFLIPVFCFSINAQEYREYAPILYFEKEETCYPVAVEYLFNTYDLKEITLTINGEESTIPFFDNSVGTINDDKIINDYQNKFSSSDPSVYPTVYYYIDDSSESTFIQYWLFYIFNDGEHNRHESDWEMVEVVIPPGEEKWVAYSQHYSGQRASWDLVEKQGSNIKVYVARGSHANYLRSYSGKLGISSDTVGNNGLVLGPTDYNLVELNDQIWLEFEGLWGEITGEEDLVTGKAGPQGPKYRVDMTNNKMWNGISWGSGLLEASSLFFMIELLLYNFVVILIVIAILVLVITILLIYRKHKKYGLGPRVMSIFYIDGLNLHTIANIMFFIALLFAIIGLFNNWYSVSANIDTEIYQTTEMLDIIRMDGINGMKIYMPTEYGPVPMGSAVLPFAYIFLIGFVFMFLSTIGINKSSKLGRKYLLKGIRFILVVVILVVSLMLIGNFIGGGESEESLVGIGGLLKSISGNPVGGSYTIMASDFQLESGSIEFQWGLGLGMILILISGILFLVAGILAIVDGKEFFKLKTPKAKRQIITTTSNQKPVENVENKNAVEEKPKFCPSCGAKLENNTKFCHECGNRI